jgi:hypothetical protein
MVCSKSPCSDLRSHSEYIIKALLLSFVMLLETTMRKHIIDDIKLCDRNLV